MKKSVKFFSLLLAIIMAFSVLPLTTWAAENAAEEETVATEIRGKCGANLEWVFEETTGTLTVLGMGAMDDFTDGAQPWAEYRPNIIRVVISDDITSIGDFAFATCPDLEEVKMGESVKRIGDSAFSDCTKLYTIKLSEKTEEIGEAAFSNCKSLYFIEIPDGIQTISQSTFWTCSNLYAIILPDTLAKVEIYAFQWCSNLTYVYYAGNKGEWLSIDVEAFNVALTDAEIIMDYCEHRQLDLHKPVPANCKETGYSAGLFCVECDKYLFGHDVTPVDKKNHDWVVKYTYKTATCVEQGCATFVCSRDKCHIMTGKTEIDPNNHTNTEYAPPVAPTGESLGYTDGEYCKDCKTYYSGHKAIPMKAINFVDSDVAVLVNNNVLVDLDIKIDMLLSHTDENAYITDFNDETYSVKEYAQTGHIIVTPKGKQAYVAVVGDANGDGEITAADARIALRVSVKLDKNTSDNILLAATDINGDEVVTAKDARTILRASVGLEEDLFGMRVAAING